MSIDGIPSVSFFTPLEQVDNPAAIAIVSQTGLAMARVSKFWKALTISVQQRILSEFAQDPLISTQFPEIYSLTADSLPCDIIRISLTIRKEVRKIFDKMTPEAKEPFLSYSKYQIFSSPGILSHVLFVASQADALLPQRISWKTRLTESGLTAIKILTLTTDEFRDKDGMTPVMLCTIL